jgi:DNA-binding XRE family transcriptional regulator
MSREAEWFKLTRIRLELSTIEMGKIMGLTKATICNIESGKCTTFSTLRYYELTLDQLKSEKKDYKEITI